MPNYLETAKLDFHGMEERRWTGPRLRNATIVGHTTTSSTRLWVRTRKEGKYHLILCENRLTLDDLEIGNKNANEYIEHLGDNVIYTHMHNFRNATDRTHVFDIDTLSVGTRYYYYVISNRVSEDDRVIIGRQVLHSFKTISSDISSLVFGLYSCHDPHKNNSDTLPWKRMYSVLEEQEADFVIGGGDQVYVDKSETDIWKWLTKIKKDLLKKTKPEIYKIMQSWYQDVYRGYWGFPDVRRVHRSFPNYMIWDDHEIMDGWGSRTRSELSNEIDTWYEWEIPKDNLMLADTMFEAAKTVYGQYQHGHNPPTAKGVFDFQLVQKHSELYFMDMRGKREFDEERLRQRDGSSATDRVLGKHQLARLLDWLNKISAGTRIIYIVSPVPVVHWTGFVVNTADVLGIKDDLRDEWDHETNHIERNKILDAVFKVSDEKGIPVAFLSGDVHMSAAYRLMNNNYRKARVFQITSSPITRPPAPKIASIILSDAGYLKTGNVFSDYQYKRLGKFHSRNFCVLNSQVSDKGYLTVDVTFHGEAEDRNEAREKQIILI